MAANKLEIGEMSGGGPFKGRMGKPIMADRLPLWVKGTANKFEVFPIHMLEQHNGKWGFPYARVMGNGGAKSGDLNPYWLLFKKFYFSGPTITTDYVYLLEPE